MLNNLKGLSMAIQSFSGVIQVTNASITTISIVSQIGSAQDEVDLMAMRNMQIIRKNNEIRRQRIELRKKRIEMEKARLEALEKLKNEAENQSYDQMASSANQYRTSIGLSANVFTVVGPLTFTFAQALSKSTNDETESFNFRLGTSF